MEVQANEHTWVNATDVISKIENDDEVNLKNSLIFGEINVSSIKLKTIPNPQYNKLLNEGYSTENLVLDGINENISIVESNIKITDSFFESGLDLSCTSFNAPVDFDGTVFNDSANFAGSTFYAPANFNRSTFYAPANFNRSTFNDSVYFSGVDFNDSANFVLSIFNAYTHFSLAPIDDNHTISNSNAPVKLSFSLIDDKCPEAQGGTYFNAPVDFGGSTFNAPVDFDASFFASSQFMFATFNAPADFTFSTFNAPVDFDGTVFNDSANFAGSTFNYSGDLNGPDTFKQIITSDEKTCDLFRKFYKNEARYDDADNIYYDYQKFAQDNNDLSLFLLSDFLSWITCGYGVRLSHTIGCIVGILVVFSFLYWGASRFYRLLDASEKKSKVSRLEPILISIRAFTTLGSADWYSKNYLFRILVAVEGLLGWIMLGIFMATLTNLLMRS